jgi:hypothetical protein
MRGVTSLRLLSPSYSYLLKSSFQLLASSFQPFPSLKTARVARSAVSCSPISNKLETTSHKERTTRKTLMRYNMDSDATVDAPDTTARSQEGMDQQVQFAEESTTITTEQQVSPSQQPSMETVSYQVSTNRTLYFESYSLSGRSDLTCLGKATGEAMWPCAYLMADYILEQNWTESTRLLELGCGLGLCGTLTSVLLGGTEPASQVVLTDGDQGVMDRSERILSRNSLPEDAPVSHCFLRWGDEKVIQSLKGTNGFDLIIASDILYEGIEESPQGTVTLFAETVNALLAPSSTATSSEARIPRCLISVQVRSVPVDILIDAFQKLGFIQQSLEGDCFEDIFGERHDEQTMCTVRFLLCFVRGPDGEEAALHQGLGGED